MLDRLPRDLLKTLPGYLHTLADFRALILTSRYLYIQCEAVTADELFTLATRPETGLQPYPHLLIAVKARALSNYAAQSPKNTTELHKAIKKGPESLLEFGLKISPLTKDDSVQLCWPRSYQLLDILRIVLEYDRCTISTVDVVCTTSTSSAGLVRLLRTRREHAEIEGASICQRQGAGISNSGPLSASRMH